MDDQCKCKYTILYKLAEEDTINIFANLWWTAMNRLTLCQSVGRRSLVI